MALLREVIFRTFQMDPRGCIEVVNAYTPFARVVLLSPAFQADFSGYEILSFRFGYGVEDAVLLRKDAVIARLTLSRRRPPETMADLVAETIDADVFFEGQ